MLQSQEQVALLRAEIEKGFGEEPVAVTPQLIEGIKCMTLNLLLITTFVIIVLLFNSVNVAMNVSITPQLEHFLQERVQVGRFNNVSEAVRAAVRLLQAQEQEYEERIALLRVEVAKGFDEEPVAVTPQLIEDIKARGRERRKSAIDE